MDFLIATNNNNKVKEIEKIMSSSNSRYYSLKDAEIESNPKENGASFLENARIKALAALESYNKSKKAKDKLNTKRLIILADDSGLCVDALDGAPGLYSARFSSNNAGNASSISNNQKLLELMSCKKNRKAHFECCVVALIQNNDGAYEEISCTGSCYGKIGHKEIGNNGFGYDPLFYPDFLKGQKTLAELSSDEKNKISHRAIALKKLQILLFMC